MGKYSPEEVAAIDKKYNIHRFVDAPPSQTDVPSIQLDAIDLSLFKEGDEHLEARKRLAAQLEKSITTYGFFNVVNFGISEEEIEELRAIARGVLKLPYEVQEKYLASAPVKELEDEKSIGGERGQGFKPKGYWVIKDGVRDSINHYNFRETYFDSFLENTDRHPELVSAHLDQIAAYYNAIHRIVLPKLLSLCDLIFEVPEGTTLAKYFHHNGTNLDTSETHGRFMMYEGYDDAQKSKQTAGTWLRGHSDISGFTFITSQPILALQIKDYFDGEWKYVKHRPHSLVVNIGDAMEFISGGFFKACLHRVIEPPDDQKNYERLVIIHFCNPSRDADLDPELLDSERLRKLGYTFDKDLQLWEKIKFHQWDQTKGKLLGLSQAQERNQVKYFGRAIERWHHFGNKNT